MIDVITCRGTGEPHQGTGNMLCLVTAKLDPAKYQILGDLDYPASIGVANQGFQVTGVDENQSITDGVANLVTMIQATPNTVAVLGYSLGSEVVTRFNEAQARGEYADCDVAFTATMANPLRVEGDSIDPNPYGWGINGQHDRFPDRPHLECANPADPITSCPPDSPLRTFADTVSAFSFAQLGGWTHDLADRLLTHRWQPASLGWWTHPVKTWQLYDAAADDIYAYLSGAHNLEYEQNGFIDRFAAAINAL